MRVEPNYLSLDTDRVMWDVYTLMHRDLFQHVATEPAADILEARARSYRPALYASPYNVKCRSQLASWLKRYRFASDVFTDQELEDRTNHKFLTEQLRIGTYKPITHRSYLVVQEARRFIKGVLGAYKDEEIYRHCRFSRNSTVGFRSKKVYLDKKIYPGSILTGTRAECKWFTSYLQGDRLLKSSLQETVRISKTLKRRRINFDYVDSLKQVNVPKNAEIHRPVRPNTLIGSFRSLGIGALVKERIHENLKINLNYLQERHRDLARISSRSMHLVTADMSSASDNFTCDLMNRLIPRDWLRALRLGRTPYVEVGGRVIWSPSFMAMGIGYTFPVMTLCFLAILRAIQKLSGTTGTVSVFGDDLIYPVKIHHFVVGVFNDLNLRVNLDKTYVVEPFRESCGGDYYDKIDVRPARPEGVREVLKGHAICAYVYKLFNSLIRRWEEVELPLTFTFLRSLIIAFCYEPCHVPDYFPDTSGFKDGAWRSHARAEQCTPNRRKPFYNGLLIPCLTEHASLRPVGYQGIFLWESLQEDPVDSAAVLYSSPREVLIWRREKAPKDSPQRKGKKGYRKLVAFQTKRGTRFFDLTCNNAS